MALSKCRPGLLQMIETFIGWGEGRYFRGRREGGYILIVLNIKVIGTYWVRRREIL